MWKIFRVCTKRNVIRAFKKIKIKKIIKLNRNYYLFICLFVLLYLFLYLLLRRKDLFIIVKMLFLSEDNIK